MFEYDLLMRHMEARYSSESLTSFRNVVWPMLNFTVVIRVR